MGTREESGGIQPSGIRPAETGLQDGGGWIARKFERETGVQLMTGREFFELYGIPAAIPQEREG